MKVASESNMVFKKRSYNIKKRVDRPSLDDLSFYYQIVFGLKTKLLTLSLNTVLNDFDIISIFETWLSPNNNNAELNFKNYKTYCSDKSTITSNCSRGGGILIAVNNKYFSHILPIRYFSLPISPIEHIFFIVKINFDCNIFGNVYFPSRYIITILI